MQIYTIKDKFMISIALLDQISRSTVLRIIFRKYNSKPYTFCWIFSIRIMFASTILSMSLVFRILSFFIYFVMKAFFLAMHMKQAAPLLSWDLPHYTIRIYVCMNNVLRIWLFTNTYIYENSHKEYKNEPRKKPFAYNSRIIRK